MNTAFANVTDVKSELDSVAEAKLAPGKRADANDELVKVDCAKF